ncbi:MAG: energy-coupling factor transporter ATPase [Clostridiales bacterium]|nr:energy-coupling factor transporter ATPase [Clostridiales bacterium]
MPIIETERLTYTYGVGTPFEKTAMKDVTLSIEEGEFIGVIGHTGSGKSTLMQHLNGLLKPTSGRVLLNGKDIWEKPKEIRRVRFQVGLCFQYPEYQLFEDTVYKDISFGPKNMGLSGDELDRQVRRAAEFVGLREELLEKSPFDLSGGEKRRAAIAGVLAMNPRVLILDEPTAGLDPKGRDMILEQIRDYQKASGTTVLLVSHSMEDVARLASRVLVMNHAQVQMFGTVEEIFSRAGELSRIGLAVPQVTQVFLKLKERGFPVNSTVYTARQGRDEILRLLGERGKNHAW